MFRIAAALAASALLAACALERDVDVAGYQASELPAVQARPIELTPARVAAMNDSVSLQRAQGDSVRPVSGARAMVAQPPGPTGVDVDVELESRLDAVALTGLFAVPSCGWWPIASADAVGSNGQVSFNFVPRDEVDFSNLTDGQLFFFADHDGDGHCDETKGDEVFTAPLTNTGGTVFQVALASLQPSPYSCSLFEYLP